MSQKQYACDLSVLKTIIYQLAAILLMGCSVDNFKAPNATLTGRVVDNITGDLIENGGVNDGTVIQLFEGSSRQPILCKSFPNGDFVNARLFPGNYKLYAVGAFERVEDTLSIRMDGDSNVDIKVVPHLRLETSLISQSGSAATIRVGYEVIGNGKIINELSILWSTIDNPNFYTFHGGNLITARIEPINSVKGEHIFTASGLTPGAKYYFRAAGRTNASGNFYNYSKTISNP